MAQHVDLVHGLQHPQPIFGTGDKHGFRATKGLLLQLLACIVVLREIFLETTGRLKIKFFNFFDFYEFYSLQKCVG